jgi:hypothetical protein
VVFDASTTAVMKFSTVASIFCTVAVMSVPWARMHGILGATARGCKLENL